MIRAIQNPDIGEDAILTAALYIGLRAKRYATAWLSSKMLAARWNIVGPAEQIRKGRRLRVRDGV